MLFKIILLPFKLIGYILGKLFGFIPPVKKNMTGLEFESYIQLLLKHLGYKKVHLTNIQDYGIDVLAYKKKKLYGFQCKYYSSHVGVSSVQQVVGAKEYYGCDKIVVVTNNTFTSQAITLATTNNVELWDGTYLNKLRHIANGKSILRRKEKETFNHPYLTLLTQLLDEPLINVESIQKYMKISDDKADYLLDELEFLDLVSEADRYGMRERLYSNKEELIEILKN